MLLFFIDLLKLGYAYSYGQIERIRVRYLYISGKINKNNK